MARRNDFDAHRSLSSSKAGTVSRANAPVRARWSLAERVATAWRVLGPTATVLVVAALVALAYTYVPGMVD